MNIIVGNNDAGKSTLLEAISLVLNGRLNGRWIGDELNPYWFNTEVVRDFFDAYNLDSRRHLTRNKCKTRQIKVWTVF